MKTRKLLWKLFPNTIYAIWKDALDKGTRDGKASVRADIERNLRMHDVADFDEPGLILGYNHAVKAMRGELTEVV